VSLAAARPAIPVERHARRLDAARAAAADGGIDALLIGVGADLVYLTGYGATPTERLTMLALPVSGPARLVAPRLEAMSARACPAAEAGILEVVAWDETDDPIGLVTGLDGVAGMGRIAVSDRLWGMFLLGLQAALPEAGFELASGVTRDLRIVKDDDEIELLGIAAEAADRVIESIAVGPLVGRSEASVAREVRDRLVAEGHDSAEFAIVASGPNSASPHHGASDRVIAAGEPIVLDIGGLVGGYASDMTRTVWVSGGDPGLGPDDEFRRIYGLVHEANLAATEAAQVGTSCAAVDGVARSIIHAAGYGDRFIHRTGHGIGLEGHEDPYIVAGNETALASGMAFSIEPGIYIEGRYGVRIEDIVVCTADGPGSLNRSPRELLVVDGRSG
jgi:Xaa-Pro aminopeptidase